MNLSSWIRSGVLLAINLLFLSLWGFAGLSKVMDGIPAWWGDKFGKTFFATFPGLAATFWLLAISELLAFGLGIVTLARGEFLNRKEPAFLALTLMWSLFVFCQLGFGQWLTQEFNGAFQQFVYFAGTLLSFQFVSSERASRVGGSGARK
jgi:hypothetical protein